MVLPRALSLGELDAKRPERAGTFIKYQEGVVSHGRLSVLYDRGGKSPKKLYEDEQVVAFYDINPQAKVHFLVVPKKHIVSAAALTEEDGALLGHIFAVIAKLAAEQGLNNGYRVISNVGEDAGQTVKHLHFHVLGGEKLPV